MIYHTGVEQANNYITDAVDYPNWRFQ